MFISKMKAEFLHDLKYDVLGYLLNRRQAAWIRYQTLVTVLGREQIDYNVMEVKTQRDNSAAVKKLREKQLPDGSFPCSPWRHVHRFYFHQLIDMGYGMEDKAIQLGVESLLVDQLPGGGYNPDLRTAKGDDVPLRSRPGNWSPCMTAFVTNTLIDLGLRTDSRVIKLIEMIKSSQRSRGGWICKRSEGSSDYCILGATGWAFVMLVNAGMLTGENGSIPKLLDIFRHHKGKIIRHGYHRDQCYRCDEALLLPSLKAVGLAENDNLFCDLYASLLRKQQPNGSWMFNEKLSPWYTLEVIKTLRKI